MPQPRPLGLKPLGNLAEYGQALIPKVLVTTPEEGVQGTYTAATPLGVLLWVYIPPQLG